MYKPIERFKHCYQYQEFFNRYELIQSINYMFMYDDVLP